MQLLLILLVKVLPAQHGSTAALDYAFFKERVQPIFLAKRSGHARCVACHTHRVPPLQPLAAGAEGWNDQQSRQNFEVWKQFVTPGEPLKSLALLHPLAEAAGGDRFHAGGKHWKSQSDPEWQTLAAWVRGEKAPRPALAVRVFQTNAAGDNIHVIDPATNKITGVIEDIEVPHGAAIAPDGSRLYVSNEARQTLDIVDARSLRVTRRIPLSGRPNNVDVGINGAYVYVGIRQPPGAVDIIDAASQSNIKSVAVKGEVHNVYVTPDGRHVVAGSIAASTISVIDAATHSLDWTLTLSSGIRPMAFTRKPDGSTKEIIVQLSDFHGLAIVDFAARKEVRRFAHPDPPGQHKETQGLQGSPSHGLAITPDGKKLWATSKYYDSVFAYSLPDYRFLKTVQVGLHPDWLSIPPDGKNLYVAIAGGDKTVVIDNATMDVVTEIQVGSVPKRVVSGRVRID